MKKKLSFVALIAFFVSMFAWQTTTNAAEKTYQIGTDVTYAPFEFLNAKNEYVGIDIDLLHAIAEDQGFKFDLRPLGFDSSAQGVQANQLDGIIAGMSMTDERKKVFDFSQPYFDSGIQMAVKNSTENITSWEDLTGETVGAKVGTESARLLEENKSKYGYKIKNYDDGPGLYGAAKNGSVIAIFDDFPVIGYAIKSGEPLKLVGKPQTGNSYGFAVKKGQNEELLKMFNDGLANVKASGEYDRIVNKYVAGNDEQTVDESSFMGILKNNYQVLLVGLGKTLVLALVSFALAIVVGIFIGLLSVSPIKPLRVFASIYVDIIRGIPMMVLAFFIFFGLSDAIGITIPDFAAGIITLTLNASAYIAEIVRGGINAVPAGQMEAARSLGMSYNKTMRKIVLPQAVRLMIPSFVNQFVISLKDTTIISVIGVVELLQTGKIIVARTMQSTSVYLIIAIMYLVVITALTRFAKVLEKKVK